MLNIWIMFFVPPILSAHVIILSTRYTYRQLPKRRIWLHVLPYVVGIVYTAGVLTHYMIEVEGYGGIMMTVLYGVLGIIGVTALTFLSTLVFNLVLGEMIDTDESKVSKLAKYIVKREIKGAYSPHVASLACTLIDSGIISVQYNEPLRVLTYVDTPKGHPDFGQGILSFLNILLGNLENTPMRAAIEDACVRDERINQIAFLLAILTDEEKYTVFLKEYNPEYKDELNVISAMSKELAELDGSLESLKARTDLSEQELRELRIKQEIADLKRGSDVLRLTHT